MILAIFLRSLLWWLDPRSLNLLISMLVVAGLTVTFALNNHYATSMVRVLQLDSEEAEWAIRLMFKDKNITFSQQADEEVYIFKFPSPGLTLTIAPYVLHNAMFERDMNPQPAAKVIFEGLNAKNRVLTKLLAEAINEVANQRADHWNNDKALN
ncbi:MAG: hypothetical protein AAF629_24735 [Chloroflexota bacterium]